MKMNARNIRGKLTGATKLILTPRYALLILIAVSATIRLLPMRFKYLLGYDPYFHLAYIRYALTHGWVNFFPYALGPWGFQVHKFHPLGLWMTPAYVYRLFHPLSVSLYNAFRITPVIFGVLTVVLVYLSVLNLYGEREAFLSAFLLAVSFGHVFRSMAGYYRGDNYMLFLYSVALFAISLGLTWNWKQDSVKYIPYLLSGIVAGFASIFWSAYYPIFAFLLSSGVFLSVGAFLTGEDRKILDGLIVSLSTTIGALLANYLGSIFGYGMVGYNHWQGKKLAEELGVHFGLIKDTFLAVYLKYAVPVGIIIILGLLVLSRVVHHQKERLLVIGVTFFVFLALGFRYYGTFSALVERLFPPSPILETQRTNLSALWEAYGPSIFLAPAFLLSLRKKTVEKFLLLGTAVVVFPMLLIWTRFLFIGSLAVAVLGGIGIVALHDVAKSNFNLKKPWAFVVLFLLLSVPVATAAVGVHNTLSVKPVINENWVKALTYLKSHSNINDVVLTWWDEGHWVTYFAHRAPVAQGSPSGWVAQYYLGLKGEKDLMKLGVDYVVVSLDAVSKFGSIVQTANGSGYAMVLLSPLTSLGVNTLTFSAPGYMVLATPGNPWDVRVQIGPRWGVPVEVFVERGSVLSRVSLKERPTISAYVYINLNYGYAVLMNEKAFNTPLARLMFTDNYSSDYKLIYSDGGIVKIFRFIHPNVVVTAENGSIALKFQNATGTGLGIYGYLDNGTLVFKKWYGVKGEGEFILPDDLNGSVVIRYTYVRKKTVLDRGVFRIEDVLSSVNDS